MSGLDKAAGWIAEQLCRPDDNDTKILTKEEIDGEIERDGKESKMSDAEIQRLKKSALEHKERDRVLARDEITYRGKPCALELCEATQTTCRISEESSPLIGLGDIVIPAFRGELKFRTHKLIIVRVDGKTEDYKVLSELSVSQDLGDSISLEEGFDEDDLKLVVKAWTHHGGSLTSIQEGLPYYLSAQ